MIPARILSVLLSTLFPLSAATLSSGHVDLLGFGWDGVRSTIIPQAYVDRGAVIDGTTLTTKTPYSPSSFTTLVPEASIVTPPSTPAWSFLGHAGDPVWVLPQSQNLNLPWTGLSTEDPELRAQSWVTGSTGTRPFTVTLTQATIPLGADFSIYTIGAFGTPTVLMATSDGISSADRINVPVNTHAHYNWAFTDPGTYELTFEFTANHATLGLLKESATYSFNVVPEPSTALLSFLGTAFLFRRRR